ncbi:MAG: helix-turn-helix transcriptional regulator [Verrucomicrobia bacterium]|nr:helix-turn-helix transcriptional regulator [Verrucomicrobiota bacterium]
MPVATEAEVWWHGTKDSLHIYLEPELITRAVTSFELDLSPTGVPPLDSLILPDIRATMLAVEAELTNGGLGGPVMIESLANILAVRLIRHIYSLRPVVTRTSGILERRKLKTIIDYIMANLNGRPTLEQMSALVQVSSFHFARQFKASIGLSPHQFLITRRVERAPGLRSKSHTALSPTWHNPALSINHRCARTGPQPLFQLQGGRRHFLSDGVPEYWSTAPDPLRRMKLNVSSLSKAPIMIEHVLLFLVSKP